jgi:hypothetical protein
VSLPEHEFVSTSRLSRTDAEAVSKAIAGIERAHGRLDSRKLYEAIVEAARPARHPLHRLFEWDNTKAAERWRIEQAKRIVAEVRIVFLDAPKQPVRALPVVTFAGKRGPLAMPKVLSTAETTNELLANAKREALAWADRHARLEQLAELSPIFTAIKKLRQ